jgi:ribosomal protein L37AE/L43A
MIAFPELDEYGTPKTKMPDCPRCGDDELGVIHECLILCYKCGWKLERKCGPQKTIPAAPIIGVVANSL